MFLSCIHDIACARLWRSSYLSLALSHSADATRIFLECPRRVCYAYLAYSVAVCSSSAAPNLRQLTSTLSRPAHHSTYFVSPCLSRRCSPFLCSISSSTLAKQVCHNVLVWRLYGGELVFCPALNARQSFFDVQLCGMAGLGRGPCALPRVRTVGPGNVAENRP